jgi:hypothetical protein
MTPQSLVDAATNPNIAVPVSGAGAVASLMAALPHIVTIGWLAYIVVLVTHKLWKWRNEWIDRHAGRLAGDDDDA